MRLVADGGLWSTGPLNLPAPLVAVLEVSGAVLSWAVDGDATDPPSITFTNPARADWLWRVLGEAGHVAVLETVRHREPGEPVDLPRVDALPGATTALRRLAFGHWLRRWWPASDRDGIATLDRCLLDAEVALLTVAAEEYFTDDTLDSDAAGLLAPQLTALNIRAAEGDPRVVALIDDCRELAADIGLDWPDVTAATPRRDDFALAAGRGEPSPAADRIAGGVASVEWAAVPPGMFDAAENTIEWSVNAGAEAVVQVALAGPNSPSGIAVQLHGGGPVGSGVLDAAGRAVLPLHDPNGQRLNETQVWNQDWSQTTAQVGAVHVAESAETRHRVRALARARLAAPPEDAFLAEVFAAESDY
ncbi:hypothetical protein A5733_18000 [Mycobacterium sp. NS-7484]|uniref:hypothetical protein n=1 Tax=Mycobacterium sp. NS-7484 TaxID=1834161 RepID=UPI00096FA75C|nr:hypothetical protein [Mycobacterium sp. NS-7484]OMC06117.1 hypothetical protein A5733_18000 [Mycobacterium sp. NS-7484]